VKFTKSPLVIHHFKKHEKSLQMVKNHHVWRHWYARRHFTSMALSQTKTKPIYRYAGRLWKSCGKENVMKNCKKKIIEQESISGLARSQKVDLQWGTEAIEQAYLSIEIRLLLGYKVKLNPPLQPTGCRLSLLIIRRALSLSLFFFEGLYIPTYEDEH
jgi:hypothetical protein